jgi:hypothetical protein
MYADRRAQNVSPFRRVVFPKSVEAEAVKAFAAKKKIQAQQREIMLMIRYAYGDDGLQEFRAIRKQIVADRERTVYRQKELRDQFLAVLIVLGGAIPVVFLIWLVVTKGK